MKKTTYYALLLLSLVVFYGCKTDVTIPQIDTTLSATSIQGTWKITTAAGTEWKKGTGIITPLAPDSGTLDYIVTLGAGGTATFTKGSDTKTSSYTFTMAGSALFFPPDGNTGLGMFTVTSYTGSTTVWQQREPIDADYTLHNGVGDCNCELYFQKTWTLTRQ